MTEKQRDLIKELAEIIALIAEDPEVFTVDYIMDRYIGEMMYRSMDDE